MDYNFPDDLVKLQRKFFRLEADAEVAGEVTTELTDTAVALSNHGWWRNKEKCDNRFEARLALRKLVQDEGNPSPSDSAG